MRAAAFLRKDPVLVIAGLLAVLLLVLLVPLD